MEDIHTKTSPNALNTLNRNLRLFKRVLKGPNRLKWVVLLMISTCLISTIYFGIAPFGSNSVSVEEIESSVAQSEKAEATTVSQSSLVGRQPVETFSDKILFPLNTVLQGILPNWANEFLVRAQYDPGLDTSVAQAGKTDPRLYFNLLIEDVSKFFESYKQFNFLESSKNYKLKFRWADFLYNFSPHLNYFNNEDFDRYKDSVLQLLRSSEIYRAIWQVATADGQLNDIDCTLFKTLISKFNNLPLETVESDIQCKSINDGLLNNFYQVLDDPWWSALYRLSKRIDVKFPGNPITYYDASSMDAVRIVSYSYLASTMPEPNYFFLMDSNLGSFKIPVSGNTNDIRLYENYMLPKLKKRMKGLGLGYFPSNVYNVFKGLDPKVELKKYQKVVTSPEIQAHFQNLTSEFSYLAPRNRRELKAIDDSEFIVSYEEVVGKVPDQLKKSLELQKDTLDKFSKGKEAEGLRYEDLSFQELDSLGLNPTAFYLDKQRSKAKNPNRYFPQYFQEVIVGQSHYNYDWRFCHGIGQSSEQMMATSQKLVGAWFRFADQIGFDSWISGNDYKTLKNWQNFGLLNHNISQSPISVEVPMRSLLKLILYNYTVLYDATVAEQDFDKFDRFDIGSTAFLLDINPFFLNRNNKVLNWQNMNDARLIDMRTGIFININAMARTKVDPDSLDDLNLLDDIKLMKAFLPEASKDLNTIVRGCISDPFADLYGARAGVEEHNVTIDCGFATNQTLPKYKAELLESLQKGAKLYSDKGNNFEVIDANSEFQIAPVILDGVKVYIPRTFEKHLKNSLEDPRVPDLTGLDEDYYHQTYKDLHESILASLKFANFSLDIDGIPGFRVDPFIKNLAYSSN